MAMVASRGGEGDLHVRSGGGFFLLLFLLLFNIFPTTGRIKTNRGEPTWSLFGVSGVAENVCCCALTGLGWYSFRERYKNKTFGAPRLVGCRKPLAQELRVSTIDYCQWHAEFLRSRRTAQQVRTYIPCIPSDRGLS